LLSPEKKNKFLEDVIGEIRSLKREILEQNKDKKAKKIMPFMHIVMFLLTYFLSKGKSPSYW
jgi:hypothetical protein